MNGNTIKLHKNKWDADQFKEKTFKASNDEPITEVEICEDDNTDGYNPSFSTSSDETVNQVFNEIADIVSP